MGRKNKNGSNVLSHQTFYDIQTTFTFFYTVYFLINYYLREYRVRV